jgi:hypothetical protein
MPAPAAATARRKKTSTSPGGSRRRPRSGTGKSSARPRLTGRWLWAIAVVGVFLAAYVLDPGAVAGLIWACLAGQFGQRARIASFSVLVFGGFALAWALRPQAPRPVAKVRRKAQRAPARSKEKPVRTGPEAAAASDGQRPVDPG